MSDYLSFPSLMLSYSGKTKAWRKKICDWADSKSLFNYSPVRRSTITKKINYDLVNGILHMSDLALTVNPNHIEANFVPNLILHYPIINSKLAVLRGEESKRVFDYLVVVTNPNGITDIENTKKLLVFQALKLIIESKQQTMDLESFQKELGKLNDYFLYEWQDLRELRANTLLNHYTKEYNIPLIFNEGFMDALIVAEEIYMCDIVGGEPIIERLNPAKTRIFKSGCSNRIEDADIVILEDYWSPGKIIDRYYDVLTDKDRKYIESFPDQASLPDEMDNEDPRDEFIHKSFVEDSETGEQYFSSIFDTDTSVLPFDFAGNIRVLRVFWKSRRKIKKVKSFNQQTGEEEYNLYPETYVINEDLGEEEETFWINEAWEGTKIGKDIYVNMRPRLVLYNRISNPSRCHFGIIGSIYNINDSKPYSLVDMMKPYNYLYDAVHDRLNKLLAKNWGKIITLDLAKVPANWDIDKWMYYAKTANIAVVDSFKEGNIGAATGKLAGGLNNASSGVIDAELGQSIQQYVGILEFLKNEMSEVAGISKLREGQIANRETVGGVERATLQSSLITEWLYTVHDDVKRRTLECFLETAKIALRGKSKKFLYILSDHVTKLIDIEGDEFAENDYGLVVDNSANLQQLQQKMDMLALAALQNQMITFSTVMKLYNSNSIAEKQRFIEKSELEMQLRLQEAQKLQLEMQLLQLLAQLTMKQQEAQQRELLNIRDNETRIKVAEIEAKGNVEAMQMKTFSQMMPLDSTSNEEANRIRQRELDEKARLFNATLGLDKDKLDLEKKKVQQDAELKRELIRALIRAKIDKVQPSTKNK